MLTLGADGSFTFTPNPQYNGSDSFTYQTRDLSGALSNVATAAITITSVNDAPVINADAKSAAENLPLTFLASDLTANDSPGPADESGQTLTVIAVGGALNGTVVLNGDNTITFTPAVNFNGAASFTDTVCDNGTTNGTADPKCSTGTVNVTVTSIPGLVARR